jgi:hypothetical protein
MPPSTTTPPQTPTQGLAQDLHRSAAEELLAITIHCTPPPSTIPLPLPPSHLPKHPPTHPLQGLAQELRRSAAEELLALSPDAGLLTVMASPQHLQHIWDLCLPPG